MSRKVLLAFVVVMVCALAFSNAETPETPENMGDGENHYRSPRASECTDAQKKECVKGCRIVNGKKECLP